MELTKTNSQYYPMVSVGFKNVVARNRILAVVSPNSRPVRSLISEAKKLGKIIDATVGKKTKAVVILDSDHVLLSTNTVDTITLRIEETNIINE